MTSDERRGVVAALLAVGVLFATFNLCFGEDDPPPLEGYRPENVSPKVPTPRVDPVKPPETCVQKPIVSGPAKVIRPRQANRVMFFTASWCGHCKPTKTALESLTMSGWSMGPDDTYAIQVVDFDRQKDLVQQYRVESLPCLIGVVNGKENKRRTGSTTDVWAIADLVNVKRLRAVPNRGGQLRANYRDAAVMRDHLIGTHGLKPADVDGKTYEELLRLHDEQHGEVLR